MCMHFLASFGVCLINCLEFVYKCVCVCVCVYIFQLKKDLDVSRVKAKAEKEKADAMVHTYVICTYMKLGLPMCCSLLLHRDIATICMYVCTIGVRDLIDYGD